MLSKDIVRFCEVISEINIISCNMSSIKSDFYAGGLTFEECYANEISELTELQSEFKRLFKNMTIA